jgi:hypothetical protein
LRVLAARRAAVIAGDAADAATGGEDVEDVEDPEGHRMR